MTITRYVLEVNRNDGHGWYAEDHEYEWFDDAKTDAEERVANEERVRVIERRYTYDDSELVWGEAG